MSVALRGIMGNVVMNAEIGLRRPFASLTLPPARLPSNHLLLLGRIRTSAIGDLLVKCILGVVVGQSFLPLEDSQSRQLCGHGCTFLLCCKGLWEMWF